MGTGSCVVKVVLSPQKVYLSHNVVVCHGSIVVIIREFCDFSWNFVISRLIFSGFSCLGQSDFVFVFCLLVWYACVCMERYIYMDMYVCVPVYMYVRMYSYESGFSVEKSKSVD
jgi:hypothetical protein